MTRPIDIPQVDIAGIFYRATGHNPDEPKKLIVNDWSRTEKKPAAKEWGEDDVDMLEIDGEEDE